MLKVPGFLLLLVFTTALLPNDARAVVRMHSFRSNAVDHCQALHAGTGQHDPQSGGRGRKCGQHTDRGRLQFPIVAHG